MSFRTFSFFSSPRRDLVLTKGGFPFGDRNRKMGGNSETAFISRKGEFNDTDIRV